MHIGLAFDLKPSAPPPPGAPDDLYDEFDSPATIGALVQVLEGMGHRVAQLGNGRPLLESLLKQPPDLVFNFAEGTGVSRSREARVPAVCEMLEIPCTGSDPLALAVSLDKEMTRRLVAAAGVTIPRGRVLKNTSQSRRTDAIALREIHDGCLGWPLIAKPAYEGSSKGVRESCLIHEPAELAPSLQHLVELYRQPVLVEEFIDGDEVTVGIVGNAPPGIVGIMKITPREPERHFVYTLEKKRDSDRFVDYECPARLPVAVLQAIEAAALAVFETLGLRDLARVDFRMRDGQPCFLEVNPLPGLNPVTSDLPIMARLLGIPYTDLLKSILSAACTRNGLS